MAQEIDNNKSIEEQIEDLEERYKKKEGSLLFFPLANAYLRANMIDIAETILKEGLSYHPNYWAAKALLGEILFKKGDIEGARTELEVVVEMAPGNVMAHSLLLKIYKGKVSTLGDEEELSRPGASPQERHFSEPRDQGESTGKSYGENRTSNSDITSPSYEAYVQEEDDDDNEIITATLAELYFSQGFLEKAIEIYKKLMSKQPGQQEWAKRLAEIQSVESGEKVDSEVMTAEPVQPKTPEKMEPEVHVETVQALGPDKIEQEVPLEAAQQSQVEIRKAKILNELEKWLRNCQRLKKSNT